MSLTKHDLLARLLELLRRLEIPCTVGVDLRIDEESIASSIT
jgi:hypothetical protein